MGLPGVDTRLAPGKSAGFEPLILHPPSLFTEAFLFAFVSKYVIVRSWQFKNS